MKKAASATRTTRTRVFIVLHKHRQCTVHILQTCHDKSIIAVFTAFQLASKQKEEDEEEEDDEEEDEEEEEEEEAN